MSAGDDLEVAWAWRDGWTAARLPRSAFSDPHYVDRSIPAGRALLAYFGGDVRGINRRTILPEEHFRLLLLDAEKNPVATACVSYYLPRSPTFFVNDCRQERGNEVLRHFVSMVEQLSAAVPRCALLSRFAEDVIRCAGWLGPEPYLDRGLGCPLASDSRDSEVFRAFAPLRISGRCPAPEAEFDLLLGNLPEVFSYCPEDP